MEKAGEMYCYFDLGMERFSVADMYAQLDELKREGEVDSFDLGQASLEKVFLQLQGKVERRVTTADREADDAEALALEDSLEGDWTSQKGVEVYMIEVNSLANVKGCPPPMQHRARDVFADKPEDLAKLGVSDKDWNKVVMSLSRAWAKSGFSEFPLLELGCLTTLCCCCVCICVFGAIQNQEGYEEYCKTKLVEEVDATMRKYRISMECVKKTDFSPMKLIFHHHPRGKGAEGGNGEAKE